MADIKVREWIDLFNAGAFQSADRHTQIKAGWYDWFCKSTSLKNKLYKMGAIIKQVKAGGKVDLDNWYVWFKNNCPMVGPLYDDFRFADLKTGDVQFTICIDDKRAKNKYEVWGRRNNFDGPIIGFNNSRDLIKWLNTPWEVE